MLLLCRIFCELFPELVELHNERKKVKIADNRTTINPIAQIMRLVQPTECPAYPARRLRTWECTTRKRRGCTTSRGSEHPLGGSTGRVCGHHRFHVDVIVPGVVMVTY